jgi:hypothetical protein
VPGLKNAAFSADAPAAAIFTARFGEHGFEETASLLRMVRDLFIEKFGLEDADRALPSYRLEWLAETELSEKPGSAGFSADGITPPQPPENPQPKKEPAVTQQPDPAFAAREAELSEREKKIAAREAAAAHDEHVAFAERLVQEGRLLPASKDKVVAVSFAEGAAKLTPVAALREVLEAQPKVVSFGEMDLGDGPGTERAVEFAADGKAVDPAGLALHNRALAFQRQHPGTAYLDAVAAVS